MINKMYIFKFKYCYKSKHYALILSQEHNKYKYLTLTHKSKVNNKNCMRLCHNPNLNSKRLSYLVPRIKNSPIKNFSKKFLKILFYQSLINVKLKIILSKNLMMSF